MNCILIICKELYGSCEVTDLDNPIETVFVLDKTSNVNADEFTLMKDFVKDFVSEALPVGGQMGIDIMCDTYSQFMPMTDSPDIAVIDSDLESYVRLTFFYIRTPLKNILNIILPE